MAPARGDVPIITASDQAFGVSIVVLDTNGKGYSFSASGTVHSAPQLGSTYSTLRMAVTTIRRAYPTTTAETAHRLTFLKQSSDPPGGAVDMSERHSVPTTHRSHYAHERSRDETP
jgi:hypothetical protein